jgi:hypothetical protein
MRIALIQLPVPDANGRSAGANVPLAAGYLKAYACASGDFSPDDIVIMDGDTADWGGDAAVEKWILDGSFDLVAFTVYLWNLDRTRYLTRRLKEAEPSILVVAGGPEAATGSSLLDDRFLDSVVQGEGEAAFLELLRDAAANGRLKKTYAASSLLDLGTVTNPYLSGILPIRRGKSVHLETMRGCPNNCSYCFYGKSFPTIRCFPDSVAERVIREANAAGASEIYLMDPSFNAGLEVESRLARIAEWNVDSLPIHSEIRLESVTPELAKAYRAAGFASVEVGLQSVNGKALKAVNRSWDRERFLRGASLLRDEKIVVKTGIILGLPHETADSFKETLDFVREAELHADAEVYPLSLLPGTTLRAKAAGYGIEYMDRPPYWVLKTADMDETELFNATIDVENEWGVEFFEPILPHFNQRLGGFISLLDLRSGPIPSGRAADRILEHPEELANSVTIFLDAVLDRAAEKRLFNLARFLRDTNPSSLYQIVFCSEGKLPPQDLCERIAEVFGSPDSVFDLSRYYNTDFQDRFSTRIFLMTSNPLTAQACYDLSEPYLDLVIKYEPWLIDGVPEIFENIPILALGTQDLEFDELRKVIAAYSGYENLIVER